jgi:redox-sensitive bicupin YhaK (pirin superfamily)
MKPLPLRLTGQAKDLGGGFVVRRYLPAAQRQSIGPFIFFDHFGPVTVEPGVSHDVRPHPHIGLATVTYLFDGAIMHRDSAGSAQVIKPGDINWMTAGRGIVHSERGPDEMRSRSYVNHGLQLWAALPQAFEETAPAFTHTPAAMLPAFERDGSKIRVLVGEAFGHSSPVVTFLQTVYLDIQLAAGARLELPVLAPEVAVYAVDAEISINRETVPARTLALLSGTEPTTLNCENAVRLMVIGGAPLDAHRTIWWNFVSSRRARIAQAADDWEAQSMGKVAGDDEFIPLPDKKFAV